MPQVRQMTGMSDLHVRFLLGETPVLDRDVQIDARRNWKDAEQLAGVYRNLLVARKLTRRYGIHVHETGAGGDGRVGIYIGPHDIPITAPKYVRHDRRTVRPYPGGRKRR